MTRDGTAEPVSRDQTLRRGRRQGNIPFPCLADGEQDWHPYPVDPYSCYIYHDHEYIVKSHQTNYRLPRKDTVKFLIIMRSI